jgi:hypothetical protein
MGVPRILHSGVFSSLKAVIWKLSIQRPSGEPNRAMKQRLRELNSPQPPCLNLASQRRALTCHRFDTGASSRRCTAVV